MWDWCMVNLPTIYIELGQLIHTFECTNYSQAIILTLTIKYLLN